MHLCHVAFDEAAFCCKAKVQHVIKKKRRKKRSITWQVNMLAMSIVKLQIQKIIPIILGTNNTSSPHKIGWRVRSWILKPQLNYL